MKKILSVVLTLVMIFSFAGSTLATELEANILESTKTVNVVGQMLPENINKTVTVLLLDEAGDIKHIDETEIDKYGAYRVKFKYAGDVSDLSLMVKQGEEDVTETVVSTVAETEPIIYNINVSNIDGKTLIDAQIKNYYSIPDKTFTIMTAYYGEGNKLLNVNIEDTKAINDEETTSGAEYDIPEDTKEVKVFVWDNETTMIPLVNEFKGMQKDETITVLMIGSSFVDDAKSQLEAIAAADGVSLDIHYAIYGGAFLHHHWAAWTSPYLTQADAQANGGGNFRRHYHGLPIEEGGQFEEDADDMSGFTHTIEDVLAEADYDFIAIHPSIYGMEDYQKVDEEAAINMLKFLRKAQPEAELIIMNNWAYEKGSTAYNPYFAPNRQFDLFDRDEMHFAIEEVAKYMSTEYAKLTTDTGLPISLDGKPLRIVPVGQAFHNASRSVLFDTTYIYADDTQTRAEDQPTVDTSTVRTLYRDSHHTSHHYGRYLIGLVWYGCLSGNSPLHNKYVSTRYPIRDFEKQVLKEAAQKAIAENGMWN